MPRAVTVPLCSSKTAPGSSRSPRMARGSWSPTRAAWGCAHRRFPSRWQRFGTCPIPPPARRGSSPGVTPQIRRPAGQQLYDARAPPQSRAYSCSRRKRCCGPRARRGPARVADLVAAFGARRAELRLAAAAVSVTAAGRDGGRGQRRCQDQEHSAPRARVPGRSRPVAAPSAGSLAGDNHAGMLSLRRVTVKVQGRVVAAPALSWRTSARWAPGRSTGRTGLAAGGELAARTQPAVPHTRQHHADDCQHRTDRDRQVIQAPGINRPLTLG